MILKEFKRAFEKHPEIMYGFSKTDFSEYSKEYKCALVLAVPHNDLLSLNTYVEARFEQLIFDARKAAMLVLQELTLILDQYKVKYLIPPTAQSDEVSLLAPFSFKFAAINAGIGWIGKSGVLVTRKYGPRICLHAILIDEDLPYEAQIRTSECPESCTKCVDACPYKALTGTMWDVDSKRNEIIDYHLCNQKRSMFIEKHRRKNACGLCMVSCPYGI